MATGQQSPRYVPPVDDERPTPEAVVNRATTHIADRVDTTGASGVVVGLSGGIDSATTAALAVEALGANAVTALVMPTATTSDADVEDARRYAEALGIRCDTVSLTEAMDVFKRYVAPQVAPAGDEYAAGNLAARLRMCCLYAVADATDSLVVGTSNRTERLLGYFTKYGDGAGDLFPLSEYDKTTVRRVARHVGVPDSIVEKRPTAGFWEGQTDEAELGASYAALDHVLREAVDHGRDPTTAVGSTDTVSVAPEMAARQLRRVDASEHKRQTPPTPERMPGLAHVGISAESSTAETDADAAQRLLVCAQPFVREYVESTDASGLVVTLDGSVESSVAAAVAARAVGPERVHGLHLPCYKRPRSDGVDPETIAETLGIEFDRVNVRPLVSELEGVLPTRVQTSTDVAGSCALVARVRLACAYYVANTTSSLVVGTLTRTDHHLGTFTPFGDAIGDVHPLGAHYRSEVERAANGLDIPSPASEQSVSLDINAESDTGVPEQSSHHSGSERDAILEWLIDRDGGVTRTAAAVGVDDSLVSEYARHHAERRDGTRIAPTPPSETDRGYFYDLELKFE
ncbi:NAD+ synthase [Halobaculum limi]|uniref:NAD+ synthase n=1 Tax=Halobaculum limi TaxID=3031916 RepID=UPI002404BE69|nr:NAD+ synthase [Halobaculum sp. YSMS11]